MTALRELKLRLPPERRGKGRSGTLATLQYALACVKQVQGEWCFLGGPWLGAGPPWRGAGGAVSSVDTSPPSPYSQPRILPAVEPGGG